jgi:hypothetical protein
MKRRPLVRRCAFYIFLFLVCPGVIATAQHVRRSLPSPCAPPSCWTTNSYQYEIVAQTGETIPLGTLAGFGISPSINQNGSVAFVGQVADGSGTALGDTLFFGDLGSTDLTAVAPNFLINSRTFDDAVQMNDGNQIAAQDRFAGSPPHYYMRVWDGNQTNSFTLIAQSSSDGFEAVLTDPAIDFSSDVAFSALDHNFNGVLVQASPPYSQLNQVPLKTPLRPLIADDSSVVVRAGNTDTSPIMLYTNNMSASLTIADTSQFSKLGQSPGISRDGVIVAFAGDLNSNGTMGNDAWDAYPGPGIFAAVIGNGAIQYRMRIAGFHDGNQDGMKQIQVDTDTSPPTPVEGAPWCDTSLGDTCAPAGELEDLPPFSSPTPVYFNTFTEAGFQNSTEWENRIAVTHSAFGANGIDGDTVIASFIATPNMDDSQGLSLFSANQGLWTVRADLFLQTIMKQKTLAAHVYRPIPVIQIGSSLGSTGATVTGLAVYDQLANVAPELANGDHWLGYWVSTDAGSGGQMILRSSYIQQYGTSGFNAAKCKAVSCATGTLGSLVNASGANYVLSNDHVLGLPVSKKKNGAKPTNPVVKPGPGDYLCRKAHTVGTFYKAPTLATGVDAALATLNGGEVNITGQIYNVGIPASTSIAPSVGMQVAKQGRSSGLTCGTITMIKSSFRVPYESCAGAKFSVPFKNQIEIESADPDYPFLLGGDSGSLVVNAQTAQPVALAFSGTSDDQEAYGNPVSKVAATLSKVVGHRVTFAGGAKHSVPGCHFTRSEVLLSPAETERADVVKRRYAAQLMKDPAVLGVGVGGAPEDPTRAVVVVMIEAGKRHTVVPPVLDGVPTKLVFRNPVVPKAKQSCLSAERD